MKYEPTYQCLACNRIFRQHEEIDPKDGLEYAVQKYIIGLGKYTVHKCADGFIGLGSFIGFADADKFEATDGYNFVEEDKNENV